MQIQSNSERILRRVATDFKIHQKRKKLIEVFVYKTVKIYKGFPHKCKNTITNSL